MMKWIKKKIQDFYDSEFEGKVVIKFTIYDVLFVVLILVVLWMILR